MIERKEWAALWIEALETELIRGRRGEVGEEGADMMN